MFIKWNGTNVHAMPSTNHAANILNQSPQDVKWLQPGWNEFPAAVWEQNKNNPSIQMMLKKKQIELLNETVAVKVKDKKTGKVKSVKKTLGQDDREMKLSYFDEVRAVEIVKSTFNRDMLQRWIDEETRHKVKRALTKQLEPLLNKPTEEE